MTNNQEQTLTNRLLTICPKLSTDNFRPQGEIEIWNDADGKESYIAKWDLDIPIPEGFTFGKPE